MAALVKYVVTQPFTVSYENGKQSLDLREGDLIEYDGLNFSVGDVEGVSSSLKVVVRAGEWLSQVEEEGFYDDEEPAKQPVLHHKPVVMPTRTYNATGGVQVEMSDPAQDNGLYEGRRARSSQEDDLGTIVKQYEEGTERAGTTMITSDEGDIRREVESRPQLKVMIPDVQEVARVSKRAGTAESRSGVVTASAEKSTRRSVVQSQTMAKQTAPEQRPDGYRHLKVDTQATGTVVAGVTDRSDRAMATRTAQVDERKVVEHQKVVKKTNRPALQKVDVGSSTKAAVESQRVETQDVKVVGKVKDEFVNASRDGITSTMTVRSSDELGDGSVTSSSTDIGVELYGGDDLDVSDILQDA